MSFKRPGKVSAFQVNQEDQRKSRQPRSYRNSSHKERSSSYDSPSHSDRSLSSDRATREDYERHRYRGQRHQDRGSEGHIHDVASNYSDREESSPQRHEKNVHRSSEHDRSGYSSQHASRDKSGNSHESHYKCGYSDVNRADHRRSSQEESCVVVDVRQDNRQEWNSNQYSDSDEELLHESLRRRKHQETHSSSEENQRWLPDRCSSDKKTAEKKRKRKLKDTSQHDTQGVCRTTKGWKQDVNCGSSRRMKEELLSESDIDRFSASSEVPSKVWKQDMNSSSSGLRVNKEAVSERDKHLISKQISRKKLKSRKNFRGKEKKQKSAVAQATGSKLGTKRKIPSLMDLEFPPSVSARNLEKGSSCDQPNVGSMNIVDKHGRFSDTEFDDRARFRFKRVHEHAANSASCLRMDDRDDRRSERLLPSNYDVERSCRDHGGHSVARDSRKCGSYLPERQHCDQDTSVASRKNRRGFLDHQDTRTGSIGRAADSRSPDFHRHTDSDQDSDRDGTRRSWREEKRGRHTKKKDEKPADDDEKVKPAKAVVKKERANFAEKSEKGQVKKPPAVSVEESETSSDLQKGEPDAARHLILPAGDSLVVFLPHPYEICLRGRGRVCVMAGSISIMGYRMDASPSKNYDVFSPASCSFLTVHTLCVEKDKKVLRKTLRTLGLEEKSLLDFVEGAVILVVRHLNTAVVDFFSMLPTFSQLFKFNLDRGSSSNNPPPPPHHQHMVKLGLAVLPRDQVPGTSLRFSSDFDFALQKWLKLIRENAVAPVAVMCGGQNCGKSTFARHMINVALNIVPKVCFLECDVGQTEFSPPGSVALTIVDKPLLGPPFCHQTTAESMCFLGLTSPGENPTRYIHCLQHVFQVYKKQDPPLPLVVNTMGWNEGLGLKLFMDTMNLTTPDLVVQLDSNNPSLNFPTITTELVAQEPGWLYNIDPVEDKKEKVQATKTHELVIIKSLVTSRDPKAKLTPRNQRDLALLAHLIRGLQPEVTLTTAVPYAVPWRKIAVHVCHSPVPYKWVLSALNASVVALCKADLSLATKKSEHLPLFFEETPVCDCFGYGLVRGIDMEKDVLLIVTGIPQHCLASVNTLLRGAISTPDQLFFRQRNLDEVPYVDALEPATAVSSLRPRTHMPRITPFSLN